MDAKSKASFINSVAGGQSIPCPKCNILNNPESKFCVSCGAELTAPSATDTTNNTPFVSVAQNIQQTADKSIKYVEPASVFADGLPSWDIVPPQVMVRRRR